MNILSAISVTKRYANHTALSNVDIAVPQQSIFGLLGPNGAGKTTFIRVITQIIAPDEGEVFFNGQKLTMDHTRLMGYLPEERGLYKKMKVGEQALYLTQLKGISKQDALKKLHTWFERFEIQPWWNRKVEELSKGMQQKVQFIITVIHEPRLLIFDEPFSGFDPINVNIIKEEILRLRDNGATIVFSTHNMASVEELCDHIALINKSVKILDGKMNEIKKAYKSNAFEIDFDGFSGDIRSVLPADYELLEKSLKDGHQKVKIRIPDGTSPNALLETLLPHISITGFHEILPSMNDIFISKVNET
ncbi:MAG: ATP-binding cassette domain-containing protein [Bacteroidetes bacterium]|nr:ATP-binding cassette domain-containing protein [Bacteroidota bacterium]